MTEPKGADRTDPPLTGDEAATLLGFLDYHRATFAWKTDGLDAAGFTATVGASTMTLGGMMKHLAKVESSWFGRRLSGREPDEPWSSVDWQSDPDWEWRSAADDEPDALRRLWRDAVARARADTDSALRRGGLDQVARQGFADGTVPSLRWILVHMIEEYARHNGHADLLRESIDGETGE